MKTKQYFESTIVEGEETDRRLRNIEYINQENQIVKSEIFEDDNLVQIANFLYHNDKVIEETTEYLKADNKTTIKYQYENSLLISQEEYSNGALAQTTTYSYDQNKNQTSIIQRDENNFITHKILIDRNESEEVIQYSDENDFIYLQEIITKNLQNQITNIVRSDFYFDTNNVEQEEEVTTTVDYDTKGNIQCEKLYREDKLTMELLSMYNSKNKIEEEHEIDYLENTESKSLYKYDHQDRLILESKLENDVLMKEEKHFYYKDDLTRIDRKEFIDDIYFESRTSIEIK